MKLAILYTGGTIGCTGSPLIPLTTKDFKRAFFQLIFPILSSNDKQCELEFIDYFSNDLEKTLDSTNLQPSDWCQIAENILNNYDSFDAFIVLHGTDTMAWTASALSFLFTGLDSQGKKNAQLNKPIIFTGSQSPLFYQEAKTHSLNLNFNSDALSNICGSITAAHHSINEVCLYFNHQLFRGNRSIKSNANHFDAFSSPNYPILAKQGVNFLLEKNYVDIKSKNKIISLENSKVRDTLKKQLNHIKGYINQSKVMPFLAFPAFYDDNDNLLATMLENCLQQKIDGIILDSYGCGNFPSGNDSMPEKGAVYQCLKKFRQQGLIIVDCSQVLTATVDLETYAAGSWLADSQIKAVSGFDMTSIASYCKLIYLLTLKSYHQWSEDKVRQLMQQNICGEISL